MKTKFKLFRRNGVFYTEDTATGKQTSLRTKDETEAKSLLNAKNEAQRQPTLNLHLARAYLTASDPAFVERTSVVKNSSHCPTSRSFFKFAPIRAIRAIRVKSVFHPRVHLSRQKSSHQPSFRVKESARAAARPHGAFNRATPPRRRKYYK